MIGADKESKTRELITYCERHGQIKDLVNAVKKMRPHISWGKNIVSYESEVFIDDANLSDYQQDFQNLDTHREYRIIQDLKSGNKDKVKRSILALSHSKSPWLVDSLGEFVVGEDEELASTSLFALKEIEGVYSAKAIASGLNSNFPAVRNWAAFILGEMALFGRRKDAQKVIGNLIDLLNKEEIDDNLLNEVVHSIGKIGGNNSLKALVAVLKSQDTALSLKATALHAPNRFWVHFDPLLYQQFIESAIPVIRKWPPQLCKSLQQDSRFSYIDGPISHAVNARAEQL